MAKVVKEMTTGNDFISIPNFPKRNSASSNAASVYFRRPPIKMFCCKFVARKASLGLALSDILSLQS
jgi:hypothetical protein